MGIILCWSVRDRMGRRVFNHPVTFATGRALPVLTRTASGYWQRQVTSDGYYL